MSTRAKEVREALAHHVLGIAHTYDAIGERFISYDDNPKEIHIRINTFRLSVTFTINSLVQEPSVFVLPWVSTKPMRQSILAEVNPHHGLKATVVVHGEDALMAHIVRMLALDHNGLLYAPKGETE